MNNLLKPFKKFKYYSLAIGLILLTVGVFATNSIVKYQAKKAKAIEKQKRLTQTNNYTTIVDRTVPSSPTAASLGSYAHAPVNLTTGLPSVGVPIWTLSGKSLSLPISLSYRPGVKTEAVSEYTGHGWSLFAGGVIHRTLKADVDPRIRIPYTGSPLTYQETVDVIADSGDPAPDVFNYNFNGHTGQFALNHNSQGIIQGIYYIKERHEWDVVVTETQIDITTEDGTKYIFGATETTDAEGEEGSTMTLVTA